MNLTKLVFTFLILLPSLCFAGKPEKVICYPEILPWNSAEGQKRLLESKYKQDFFMLAQNYEAQINPLYCGIASSVIALNSLKSQIPSQKKHEITLPADLGKKTIEYKRYSQQTFLNQKTNQIKAQDIIEFRNKNSQNSYDPGLTLKQLKEILEQHDLKVELYSADSTEKQKIAIFREILIKTLNQSDNIIIANFYGKSFGAKTGGHISPIAAYHKDSDSILITDVAAHKNPWYWVSVTNFFHGMSTKDGDNYRGYLLVSN